MTTYTNKNRNAEKGNEMPRSMKQIVLDMRTIHESLRKAIEEYDKEYNDIRNDPRYSRIAINEARSTRQSKVEDFARKQRKELQKLRNEAAEIIRNDDGRIDYKRADPQLMTFIQIAGDSLSPNDYRILAVKNQYNQTNLSLLKAAAARNNFTLDIGESAEEQLKRVDGAANELDKILENASTTDNWDRVSFGIYADNALKSLEATEPESYRCYKNDLQSAIESDITASRHLDAKTEKDVDIAFESGFRGETTNSDYSSSLRDVTAVLSGFNNPQKKARVLSAIVRTNAPERLSAAEALDSDMIKLTADCIRKSGDTKLADEMSDVASLMRKDKYVYAPEYGTRIAPDESGLHAKHERMAMQSAANAQKIAEQKERISVIKAETESNSEYGM